MKEKSMVKTKLVFHSLLVVKEFIFLHFLIASCALKCTCNVIHEKSTVGKYKLLVIGSSVVELAFKN